MIKFTTTFLLLSLLSVCVTAELGDDDVFRRCLVPTTEAHVCLQRNFMCAHKCPGIDVAKEANCDVACDFADCCDACKEEIEASIKCVCGETRCTLENAITYTKDFESENVSSSAGGNNNVVLAATIAVGMYFLTIM